MSGMTRRRLMVAGFAALPVAMVSGCTKIPLTSTSDDGEFLDVNGDRQWLLRKGPMDRPSILMLHGGPGGSETVLFRHFNRELEANFHVVYWDQRGAGRSYNAEMPPSHMNVSQFVCDLDVVINYLRAQMHRPLLLLGHSWGSALGALYAGQHADKIAGFIGVAQLADMQRQEAASYDFALTEANRRNNRGALAELNAIGPPPYDFDALMVKNRWVEAFGGYFNPGFPKTWHMLRAIVSGEVGVGEIGRLIAANNFSLRTMWPEVRTLNVPKAVPQLNTPVAFLLGCMDRQAPPSFAAEYLLALKAPQKTLVWFERSAHNIPFEEPEKFSGVVQRFAAHWT